MRRLLMPIVILCGCASAPSMSRSIDGVEVAMRATAAAAAGAAAAWSTAVSARIEYCRSRVSEDSEQARAACMGPYGRGAELEADMAAFREAYDAAAEVLPSLRRSARRVDDFVSNHVNTAATP